MFRVTILGTEVACDTAEEVRAILPTGGMLVPGNAKQRTRLLPAASRQRAARSARASKAVQRAWELARAYATHRKLSSREAFREIHANPRAMAKAQKLVQAAKQ